MRKGGEEENLESSFLLLYFLSETESLGEVHSLRMHHVSSLKQAAADVCMISSVTALHQSASSQDACVCLCVI